MINKTNCFFITVCISIILFALNKFRVIVYVNYYNLNYFSLYKFDTNIKCYIYIYNLYIYKLLNTKHNVRKRI